MTPQVEQNLKNNFEQMKQLPSLTPVIGIILQHSKPSEVSERVALLMKLTAEIAAFTLAALADKQKEVLPQAEEVTPQ